MPSYIMVFANLYGVLSEPRLRPFTISAFPFGFIAREQHCTGCHNIKIVSGNMKCIAEQW